MALDLRQRLKHYAVRIVRMYAALPKSAEAQVIGKQILRSGTSVGAQYCEATRARSRAEFTSKIDSALQELEETRYWIELLIDAAVVKSKRLKPLLTETTELNAILTSSSKTAKSNG